MKHFRLQVRLLGPLRYSLFRSVKSSNALETLRSLVMMSHRVDCFSQLFNTKYTCHASKSGLMKDPWAFDEPWRRCAIDDSSTIFELSSRIIIFGEQNQLLSRRSGAIKTTTTTATAAQNICINGLCSFLSAPIGLKNKFALELPGEDPVRPGYIRA